MVNQFHAVDNLVAVAITGGSVGIAAGPISSRVPLHSFSYPLGGSVWLLELRRTGSLIPQPEFASSTT